VTETPENETDRRFPRRFLLTAAGAAAALGLAEVAAPDAEAATTAWQVGGNSGIATNGNGYLGTKNVAPLVFKTAPKNNSPMERMRITPTGRIGMGTTSPSAKLDVQANGAVAVHVGNPSTDTSAIAALITAAKGIALKATSTDGGGIVATSTNNIGVDGSGGYSAVYGTGGLYGGIFYGNNSGAYGVYANGAARGVNAVGGDYGVFGSGTTYGVYGSGPYGLYGKGQYGLYATGTTAGVYCSTTNTSGAGVYGVNGQYGVAGQNGGTAGVRGDSNYVGVWGAGTQWGLYGQASASSGTAIGVQGLAGNSGSYGVYSSGNAHVNGTLSKTAGSFRIDHPLDPENKWLSHSFVESPDMMNVYNGNVTLDAHGKATVHLPDYFGVLNRDFRYQLTTIGGHAPVYIAEEVEDNAFKIAGGTAGLKVSWQVTGIRQDDYGREHPIKVETAKRADERGMREFVPAGSTARKMEIGARAAKFTLPAHPAEPAEAAPATPPRRGR
jgi:hypothetical protein